MNLKNIGVVLILVLLNIAGMSRLVSRSEARAGPTPIPQPTPVPIPSPIPPPPLEVPLPEVLPTPIKPTPTTNPAITVTANYKVERVLPYARTVIWWLEMEKQPEHDFHNLTMDDVPLVLAVMAAESGGDPDLVSSAGAVGLMQVIPRSWYPNATDNSMNVYWGMYILDRSLDLSEGDVRYALAYYNCGVPKVEANECGAKGGLNYADKVLDFWYPLILEKMEK